VNDCTLEQEDPLVSDPRQSRAGHRWWIKALAAACVLCGIAAGILTYYFPFSRKTVSESLLESFPGELRIDRFQVHYFPHPGCVAEGVAFRLKSSSATVPPLVTIRKLTVQSSYLNFLVRPHLVSRIELDGLRVNVPLPMDAGSLSSGQGRSVITIGEVIAQDAVLNVVRHDDKTPLQFDIHDFSLKSASAKSGASYRVDLRNPEPPGEIHSTGHIGPFQMGKFAETPASGEYSFDRADLSVFNGITGVLSSKGKFAGSLGNLNVEGGADIPNFEVVRSGHALPLQARFVLAVNATNGDVAINNLTAMRGRTNIAVNGSVAHQEEMHGKFTSLNFTVRNGHIEDLLPIFVTGHEHASPLAGETNLTARVTVPRRGKKLLEELALEGDFDISDGHFEKTTTKARLDKFSAAASGDKKETQANPPPADSTESVPAQLRGHVVLRSTVATMTDVSLSIPGADANMHGTFNIISQKIEFHGTVRTNADLSQQSSGAKSIFAKVLDPLFRKKRGTVVPVVLNGTYRDPHFGLDLNPANK
jgi:AsmA-like C-terminal region